MQSHESPTPDFASYTVQIRWQDISLTGNLTLPPSATGIVLFAHGSGSSRHSPRNRAVAETLNRGGLATLLFDLLTSAEEQADRSTGQLRFNLPLLAERLIAATDWASHDARTAALPVGYFGASTGGGAALIAAAQRPEAVRAVVSRGGRPDLAAEALPHVQAPTLLIVGGYDPQVLELNLYALDQLRCRKQLETVPRAGHLFEEPGALEHVAELARSWFLQHLPRQSHVG